MWYGLALGFERLLVHLRTYPWLQVIIDVIESNLSPSNSHKATIGLEPSELRLFG